MFMFKETKCTPARVCFSVAVFRHTSRLFPILGQRVRQLFPIIIVGFQINLASAKRSLVIPILLLWLVLLV